jgi:HNH endonuclease
MPRYQGTYEEYLWSPWWRLHVRRQALDRADSRCEQCASPRELEVHHRTYERLGHEDPDDVMVLCGRCHAGTHGQPHDPRPAGSGPELLMDILRGMRTSEDAERRSRPDVA